MTTRVENYNSKRGSYRRAGAVAGDGNRARPTHFLALPLNTHSTLRRRIAAFQTGLLQNHPAIDGLDRTIVIDPRRLHLTLGVMALESDGQSRSSDTSAPKTVSSALDLLNSLRPHIMDILDGRNAVKASLNRMDILNSERKNDGVNANVLYVGPEEKDEEGIRLRKVCDFVHRTFRENGYITETRPLKLHCTILNTSHRRPKKRLAFSYSDILASSACEILKGNLRLGEQVQGSLDARVDGDDVPSTATSASATLSRRQHSPPLPVHINLGVYDVQAIQLWIMGSHSPNNEYESCGGIMLSS